MAGRYRHELTLRGHEYGASVSCGVSVFSPAVAGTKLYCLVTEAHRCEKLAQSLYAVVPGRDANPGLLVASPTLYRDTTTPKVSMHKLERVDSRILRLV